MRPSRKMALLCSVSLLTIGLALGVSAEDEGPYSPDDYDGDGILDEFDNCITVWNGLPDAPLQPTGAYSRNDWIDWIPQHDSDEDDYGNACDWDFNNDGNGGFDDCNATLTTLGDFAFPPGQTDMNGDRVVGFDDVLITLRGLSSAPGPSGLACASSSAKGTCPPVISW